MMTFRRVAGIWLLASLGLFVFHVGSAAPPEGKPKTNDSLAARSAQIHLRLAELKQERALEINRRVPGTLTTAIMAQFADDVEVAKAQLQTIEKTGEADSFRQWIVRVEIALRAAEARLKTATQANKLEPGAVNKLDMERLRLGVELAQLQRQQGEAVASGSPHAKLQWELEMLNDSLARVQEQTSIISQNRLPEF